MSVVHLKPGELEKVLKQTGRRMPKVVKDACKIAAERGRAVLVGKTPVYESEMKNAWKVASKGRDVAIVNQAPHAGIVERGARPHGVNAEGRKALREWVIKKGLVGKAAGPVGSATVAGKKMAANITAVGKRSAKPQASFDQQVDAIVARIVNKLRVQGYKGTHFVEKSIPQLIEFAQMEILASLPKLFEDPKGTP